MRIIIKLVTWLSVILLILFLAFFLLRGILLDKAITHVINKSDRERGLVIVVGEHGFQSFFNVELKNVKGITPKGDTLFTVDSVFVSPRILSLIKGDPELSFLQLYRPVLSLYRDSLGDNFSFLFEGEDTLQVEKKNEGYGKTIYRLLQYFFRQVPDELTVNELQLNVRLNNKKDVIHSSTMLVHDDLIGGEISFPSDSMTARYGIKGTIDRAGETFAALLFKKDSAEWIPFLKRHTGLAVQVDTLSFVLNNTQFDEDENILRLNGSLGCRNFFAEHWRISPKPLTVKDAELRYDLVFTPDSFYLDSGSSMRLEKLFVNPRFAMLKGKTRTFDLKIRIPEVSVNDFFSSLPEGVFEHISPIRGSGSITYELDFRYDEAKLEDLKFHSSIKGKNIKIDKFGKADPRKMNSEFLYTAYDKSRPVRSFQVGPSNPFYTPLSEISPYLRSAVMTSEDGNFFYHKGFNEDAFRKSIIENIRERRFKRGGSTISMQLVKNVLLNRSKNVSRKLEEAVLVWLIESNRLVSKERMLEVYLNIIEWGPDVYGAGEASRFYFNKSAADIDLNESIFLAMIVPQPKGYKYHFNELGDLKEHTASYYRLIGMHLVKKGIITEEQNQTIAPVIKLSGVAGNYLKKEQDTLVPPHEIRELDEQELYPVD